MKSIKRSWGYDYVLDREFLVTLIIGTVVILVVVVLLLYGHDKICQTKNPLLIFLDRVFFTIFILLNPYPAGGSVPIC